MKKYIVNVLSMRAYIVSDCVIYANSEKEARKEVYDFLIDNDLIGKNLFYKVEIKEAK